MTKESDELINLEQQSLNNLRMMKNQIDELGIIIDNLNNEIDERNRLNSNSLYNRILKYFFR